MLPESHVDIVRSAIRLLRVLAGQPLWQAASKVSPVGEAAIGISLIVLAVFPCVPRGQRNMSLTAPKCFLLRGIVLRPPPWACRHPPFCGLAEGGGWMGTGHPSNHPPQHQPDHWVL